MFFCYYLENNYCSGPLGISNELFILSTSDNSPRAPKDPNLSLLTATLYFLSLGTGNFEGYFSELLRQSFSFEPWAPILRNLLIQGTVRNSITWHLITC